MVHSVSVRVGMLRCACRKISPRSLKCSSWQLALHALHVHHMQVASVGLLAQTILCVSIAKHK